MASDRKPGATVLVVADEDDVHEDALHIPGPPPWPVLARPFNPDVLVATGRNILAARDRTFPVARR